MVNLPTRLKVIKEDVATGLIDGGNGLGQVAAHRAMTMSIEKARRCGIGCCLVRNTNNIGFLAFYTLMAAEKGMVGIIMTNAAASMSPWGGAEAFFGTNPFSIAVPGDSERPSDRSGYVVEPGGQGQDPACRKAEGKYSPWDGPSMRQGRPPPIRRLRSRGPLRRWEGPRATAWH